MCDSGDLPETGRPAPSMGCTDTISFTYRFCCDGLGLLGFSGISRTLLWGFAGSVYFVPPPLDVGQNSGDTILIRFSSELGHLPPKTKNSRKHSPDLLQHFPTSSPPVKHRASCLAHHRSLRSLRSPRTAPRLAASGRAKLTVRFLHSGLCPVCPPQV